MKKLQIALIFILIAKVAPLWAELDVELVPPRLDEGMASLEAMLQAQLDVAEIEIRELVLELAVKPQFMKGFSAAASGLLHLPGLSLPGGQWLVSAGSLASLHSVVPLPQLLSGTSGLSVDSDMESGFGTQPLLVQLVVPLDAVAPGLDLGGQAGYMDSSGASLALRAWSVGANAGWQLFQPAAGTERAVVRWQGIRLGAGWAWAYSRLQTLVRPGRITQSVALDPDGAGPLVPLSATMVLDPELWVGMDSSVQLVRLQASTTVDLFRAVRLSGGAGGSLAIGQASVALAMDSPIQVEGYLSRLIADGGEGRIRISGTVPPAAGSTEPARWSAFVFAMPALLIGPVQIQLPVSWIIPYGLAAGVILELAL